MKSDTMTMLDRISTLIEKAVRTHTAASPARKRMTLDAFVSYALSQIQKARHDERAGAVRRLDALKRSVDQLVARIAKLNAEDLDSEKITVDVETAYAPLGGKQIEGLTTAPDQRSTEVNLTLVTTPTGNTNFAENLGKLAKALQKLKGELASKPAASTAADAAQKDAPPSRAATDKRAPARGGEPSPTAWPRDLNTPSFRAGETQADAEPVWGYDPDGLRDAKAT